MPKAHIGWGVCLAVVCAVQSGFVLARGLTPSMTVSAAEQARRDDDRLKILRDELARETRLFQEQTRRKAERSAANDTQGAQESEQALEGHRQNIESLRREMDVAGHQPVARARRADGPRVAHRAAQASSTADADALPWWDVYGHRPVSKVQAVDTATGELAPTGAVLSDAPH